MVNSELEMLKQEIDALREQIYAYMEYPEIFRDELNEIYGDEIPQILQESASLGTKRAGTGQFLALTFRTSKKASRRYIQGGKSNLNKGINIPNIGKFYFKRNDKTKKDNSVI